METTFGESSANTPSCHTSPNGVVALFDQHDVVDTMSFEEACDTGIALDYMEQVTSYICSFGKKYRQETFHQNMSWSPMVNECAGYIFTDYREGRHPSVDVYRESWMLPNCIGIRGDKGQAAKLLNRPVILFDDKEENIEKLRQRSSATIPLDGVLVRRGRKKHRAAGHGYIVANECEDWSHIVRNFSHSPHAGIRLPQ